jgi:hypothetical protein
MKKLWRKNSYAIILVVLSFVGALLFSNYLPSSGDDYKKVTVSKGETLWELSEQYADQHNLSTMEFIEWVEDYNGISGDYIFAGDELVIPIKDSPIQLDEISNLASN